MFSLVPMPNNTKRPVLVCSDAKRYKNTSFLWVAQTKQQFPFVLITTATQIADFVCSYAKRYHNMCFRCFLCQTLQQYMFSFVRMPNVTKICVFVCSYAKRYKHNCSLFFSYAKRYNNGCFRWFPCQTLPTNMFLCVPMPNATKIYVFACSYAKRYNK